MRSGADRDGLLVSDNDTQAKGPLGLPLLGMLGFSHHSQINRWVKQGEGGCKKRIMTEYPS